MVIQAALVLETSDCDMRSEPPFLSLASSWLAVLKSHRIIKRDKRHLIEYDTEGLRAWLTCYDYTGFVADSCRSFYSGSLSSLRPAFHTFLGLYNDRDA